MEKKEKTFGKRDIILLLVVFSAAALFYLVNRFLYAAPAAYVEVSVVNENSEKIILESFDLSENTEYDIITVTSASGEPDGVNHLIIQDKKVWISEANCPNHDCVKKGKISQNGEMLVCIPHRLTVTIVGE